VGEGKETRLTSSQIELSTVNFHCGQAKGQVQLAYSAQFGDGGC